MTRVAVIGAGGMGSWFARHFKSRKCSIVLADHDQTKARRLARRIRAKYASSNVEAAQDSDIAVVAVPVNAVSRVVREIVPALRENALLIDLSAVKSVVVPCLRWAARKRIRVLSIHPMFGPSASGARGRSFIVVGVDGDKQAAKMAKGLFPGARILLSDTRVHDREMALALALPHFLNMAFASVISLKELPRLRRFAGRTFDLQLLLAEAVASEPETTADIQTLNREFAPVLRDLQKQVKALAKVVESRDRARVIVRYKRIRERLSADPEFGLAKKKFEKACEASSRFRKA